VLTSLDGPGKAAEALTTARRCEQALRSNFVFAEQLDAAVTVPIVQAMRESGITGLAERIAAAGTVAEAASILLQRHMAVQSGKFDRGQQKAPWLRPDGRGTARLTSQRNELPRVRHAKSWRQVVRHPYRTSAAGSFIEQCRIA
jgi:hypothetical protein